MMSDDIAALQARSGGVRLTHVTALTLVVCWQACDGRHARTSAPQKAAARARTAVQRRRLWRSDVALQRCNEPRRLNENKHSSTRGSDALAASLAAAAGAGCGVQRAQEGAQGDWVASSAA